MVQSCFFGDNRHSARIRAWTEHYDLRWQIWSMKSELLDPSNVIGFQVFLFDWERSKMWCGIMTTENIAKHILVKKIPFLVRKTTFRCRISTIESCLVSLPIHVFIHRRKGAQMLSRRTEKIENLLKIRAAHNCFMNKTKCFSVETSASAVPRFF